MSQTSDGAEFRQTITADPTGLEAGWRRAVQAVNGGGDAMRSQFGRISSAIESMNKYFVGFSIAMAAGLGAKKLVDDAAAMTESAMDMSRALGITTNEASVLRAALEDVGATPEEFTSAAKGMSKQLKENEKDLNAMGLATRDASGKLRPMNDLVLDGVDVLNQYREGADRNIAAQALFGKGVDGTSKLLLLNRAAVDENREAVRELGLETGANAVAAWQAFDAAGDRAALSVRGVANAAGQALMPVVTDLIRAFNAAMPAAIVVVRGALGGLTAGFLYVKNGVVVLWEAINAMVISVAEPIRALGEAVAKAITGDFKGAAAVIANVPTVIVGAWSSAFDRMAAMSAETKDRVYALFATDNQAGSGGGSKGTRSAPTGPKPKEGKAAGADKADPSMMAYYQAALEEDKNLAIQQDATRDYTKQQELAFWANLRNNAQLTGKDRLDISKRIAKLETDIMQDQAREAYQLWGLGVTQWRDRELARVDIDEQAARNRLDLGQISATQLLALEEQFEQRRQQVRRATLDATLTTLDPARDTVKIAQTHAEIEALEQAHQLRLAGLRGQIAVQSATELDAVWNDLGTRMSSLWDKGINAMMNGTLTWRNAFAAVGTEVLGIASNLVKRQVTLWIFGEQAKSGATAFGTAQRWAMESLASAKSVALWAATAVKNIMASAWEAMAAAWKAVAGIPYVGPVLAVIAAGAAFAGVSALASRVASAEGGYDIPSGVNPLTQLHEKEMVLPAKYADVIRQQAEQGAAPAQTQPPVELRGVSAGDFFVAARSDLIRVLQAVQRDHAWRPAR